MPQHFHTQNVHQISFATELAEHGGRRAATRIREVGGIGQIDDDHQAIHEEKHPLGCRLPTPSLFPRNGQ